MHLDYVGFRGWYTMMNLIGVGVNLSTVAKAYDRRFPRPQKTPHCSAKAPL